MNTPKTVEQLDNEIESYERLHFYIKEVNYQKGLLLKKKYAKTKWLPKSIAQLEADIIRLQHEVNMNEEANKLYMHHTHPKLVKHMTKHNIAESWTHWRYMVQKRFSYWKSYHKHQFDYSDDEDSDDEDDEDNELLNNLINSVTIKR